MKIAASTSLFIALASSIFIELSCAATLVLRDRSQHDGSIVYLGDVADISTDSQSELAELKTTALLPAPAPGTHQYLSRTQLRDLLFAQGVNLQSLVVSGANSIKLGEPQPQEVVGQPETPNRSGEEVDALVRSAILDHLQSKTGHDRWRLEYQLDTPGHLLVANHTGSIQVAGGRRPWTGRQHFRISASGSRSSLALPVQVTKIQEVVAAVREIPSGSLIRATDVEMSLTEVNLPGNSFTAISQVVGMQATRSIAAGKPLHGNLVAAPLQVERGETVTVFARTEGISVRTFAVAQQDGALGELVQVETLDKKQRYVARVSGRRELEVLAAGATSADYATMPSHTANLR